MSRWAPWGWADVSGRDYEVPREWIEKQDNFGEEGILVRKLLLQGKFSAGSTKISVYGSESFTARRFTARRDLVLSAFQDIKQIWISKNSVFQKIVSFLWSILMKFCRNLWEIWILEFEGPLCSSKFPNSQGNMEIWNSKSNSGNLELDKLKIWIARSAAKLVRRFALLGWRRPSSRRRPSLRQPSLRAFWPGFGAFWESGRYLFFVFRVPYCMFDHFVNWERVFDNLANFANLDEQPAPTCEQWSEEITRCRHGSRAGSARWCRPRKPAAKPPSSQPCGCVFWT